MRGRTVQRELGDGEKDMYKGDEGRAWGTDSSGELSTPPVATGYLHAKPRRQSRYRDRPRKIRAMNLDAQVPKRPFSRAKNTSEHR